MQETGRLAHSEFILIFFVVLIYCESHAQVYPDARVDSLLRSGINRIVNQEYSSAENAFRTLGEEYPELPLGKIYLAAYKIAEAFDYAEDFDEKLILENLEAAKVQSEGLIKSDETNIWYRYFYALAEGYISYFNAINENWFSAISSGINSISEFEKILNVDKNFYEAYIAIGTFEYWKSRKMEFMNWLPFANDTKNIGIERLRTAIDSSSYNSHLAINSLIWIYVDQKKYEEAIVIGEKALADFPESRTFRWGTARACEEINPLKAIELYLEILDSYPDFKKENYINEITLKHLIAQQFAKLGNKGEALKYCNEILATKNIPQKASKELSGRLERVRLLRNELLKGN
jgi:tetratricopeptide (TPR) repeat protein